MSSEERYKEMADELADHLHRVMTLAESSVIRVRPSDREVLIRVFADLNTSLAKYDAMKGGE